MRRVHSVLLSVGCLAAAVGLAVSAQPATTQPANTQPATKPAQSDPAQGKPFHRNISVRDGRIADLTRRRTT